MALNTLSRSRLRVKSLAPSSDDITMRVMLEKPRGGVMALSSTIALQGQPQMDPLPYLEPCSPPSG